MENTQKDMQNTLKDHINPDHYKSETSLECIESMEIIFGYDGVLSFCMCNAWKYIWRWKNKNGMEDLNKAKWYLNRSAKYIDTSRISHNHLISLYRGMVNYLIACGVDIEESEVIYYYESGVDIEESEVI